jgi:hypothetical protein
MLLVALPGYELLHVGVIRVQTDHLGGPPGGTPGLDGRSGPVSHPEEGQEARRHPAPGEPLMGYPYPGEVGPGA